MVQFGTDYVKLPKLQEQVLNTQKEEEDGVCRYDVSSQNIVCEDMVGYHEIQEKTAKKAVMWISLIQT